MKIVCGMIPYNLKERKIMDYLALKIPADIKQKITAHTVADQPEPEEGGGYPFEGENGAYELMQLNMLQIVPAAYTDVREGHHLEGDLYCDEEGLLKNSPDNWRASQMRYWHMKPRRTSSHRTGVSGATLSVTLPLWSRRLKKTSMMETSLTRKRNSYGPAPDIRGTVNAYWLDGASAGSTASASAQVTRPQARKGASSQAA